MRYSTFFLMAFCVATAAQSQTQSKATSSYFDDSESRDFAAQSILIAGEVQNPGMVDLSSLVGYGHGMGFKGSENVTGYLIKNLLAASLKPTPEMLREWIVVGSAKDGYRVVYSLSEVLNRSDNQDFLLLDKKNTPESGRYLLYPAADFFADRDIRSVEKLELTRAE